MDGSLMNNVASCGAIFRDSLDSYLGSFTGKLKCSTMLHTTLFSIILAIEQAQIHGWNMLWVESDSQVEIHYTSLQIIFSCSFGFVESLE
jgi:hypothetical protein